MTGYDALRNSAAWFDRGGRGKIRLNGEDRARFLHAMSTNDMEELEPGGGCYTFFLNAQGRILADANVFCFDDHLLLDTEPDTREKVRAHLDQFIIADDVVLDDATARVATVAIEGPGAADALRSMGAPVPERDCAFAAWGDRVVAKVGATGAAGYFVMLPADALAAFTAALAIPQADAEAVRVVRLENRKPRYGEEITERYLVQETGQLQAISFTKGCYLGQEIVERVRSRGQVHRHLKALSIEANAPPDAGVKLQHNGKDAGEIASAAYSPALNRCVGFGYVRTDASRPGEILTFDPSGSAVVL